MTDTLPRSWSPGFKLAGIALWWAVLLHGIDHFRRGISDLPTAILALGIGVAVLANVAAFALVLNKRWAEWWSFFAGLAAVLAVLLVHVVPDWWFLSDSFLAAPAHHHINWLSWTAGILELLTGLLLMRVAWANRNAF